MKEESMAEGRLQKTQAQKLPEQGNIMRPGSRTTVTTLKAREVGLVGNQACANATTALKDRKSRAKNSETRKGVSASMVFGKVETAMAAMQNGPQVPFLEIPEQEMMLSNHKKTCGPGASKNNNGGSKLLGTETYSRVKRSLIGDFPRIHHAAQVHPRPPADSTEVLELRQLRTLVQELRAREAKLQSELLQCKSFRESANRVPELEKELAAQKAEVQRFGQRIDQLEAEKCSMAEQLAHYPMLLKEIEESREKIKQLQKQMLSENKQAEDILQQCITSTENKLKVLEVEVVQLRRANVELKHQKRDLAGKLAAAESQVVALGKLTESDMVAKVEAETLKLRHTNENLSKQVEGLQMNRFSEVEELVYLRWVNSCLRYELRNSDAVAAAAGRSSALDLQDTLSSESQDFAKQLMVDYASNEHRKLHSENDLERSSSFSPSSDGTTDFGDLSTDNLPSWMTKPRNSNLIGKLKWSKVNDDWQLHPSDHLSENGNNDDGQATRISPRRRHSISGPKESLKLHNKREPSFGNRSSINFTRASLDSWSQFEGLANSFMPKANIEQKNDVTSSFHFLKNMGGSNDLQGSYPAFKDRHKLLRSRTDAGANKLPEQGTVQDKPSCTKHSNSIDAERRVLRIHKPPPKPSEAAVPAINNGCPTTTANCTATVLIPPPPPPPPLVRTQSQGLNNGGHPQAAVAVAAVPPPPPPPPPPPKFLPANANTMRRAPQVVEFYQSLMKRDLKKDSCGSSISDAPNMSNAHSSMIGEIENRSSHLLAIKADVETQGDFVRSLIREVKEATYNNIEDVLAFVKWLDDELSFLVDERAVLKHFDWPERKADAMREAAFGYRDLKKLEMEVSSYECNLRQPCATALKKMSSLLEKCEQVIYNLLRTRDLAMARYKEFHIPTDWMLDTGIVSKIKFASVKLAKKHMERVATELESLKCSEKEPEREFLLLQGVRFAFRAHQFAGGFDAESMQAFEELRNLAHTYHAKT